MQVCTVGGGEDRLDRLRQACEAVDAADQDVAHAALLELGQHLHPELGAHRCIRLVMHVTCMFWSASRWLTRMWSINS
jgi:hypothetical protein